jgi:hypothetical protein
MKDRAALTARMSTEGTKPYVPAEERTATELSQHRDEGVGVFRGLISTALLYAAIGVLAWFLWFAWRHWFSLR